MSTISGIGTRFYGIIGPDNTGKCVATKWITFIYLPIVPLHKVEITRRITEPHKFNYQIIQQLPLSIKEIIRTYIYGWIVSPVVLLWPLIFAIKEVAQAIGYTNDKAEGVLYNTIIAFSILYIVVVVWKWKDWDEKRGLPESKKSSSLK